MAASMSFAFPVKAGSDQKIEEFMKQLLDTERKDDHHARSSELGLDRIKVWRQREPVDVVIVYLEGSDLQGALRQRASQGHEFDTWYDSMIEEISGVHPKAHHSKGAPSDLLFDWHREKGHSRTHH
jgi:hypothetical protein